MTAEIILQQTPTDVDLTRRREQLAASRARLVERESELGATSRTAEDI